MGGKSSKQSEKGGAKGSSTQTKPQAGQKQAPNSKKTDPSAKTSHYESDLKFQPVKNKPLSPELLQDSHIRSVLSLFLEGERLLQMCEDDEIFGKRMASFSASTIPCVKFLKALQKSVVGPDTDAGKYELHACIQEILSKPDLYQKQDPASALFHSLYTGLLIIRVDSFQTEKTLQNTLAELANLEYSQISGNIEETIIFEGLLRDACVKSGKEYPESPSEEHLQSVKDFVSKLQPTDIWPLTKLPHFCSQVEKVLFAHFAGDEGLEMTVPLQNFLERVRTEINKNLKNKYFDMNLIRPLPVIKHLASLTVFPCFNNLTFGKLSFFANQIFPRTKKVKCMIYIPEAQGYLRKYNCILDMVAHVYMNQIALDENSCVYRHKTLKNLIPQLKTFGDAKDIEADYDPVALYEKDGKLLMSYREEQLFGHHLDLGNTLSMKLYLFHENGVSSPDLLKILFHPNARQQTHLAESLLLVFKREDTLKTFYERLNKLYPDEVQTFGDQSDLFRLFLFTNVVCQSHEFYDQCWKNSQEFIGKQGNLTTLGDLVDQFGKTSSFEANPQDRQVDLIISLKKRHYEFNGSGREENTVTELKMRLSMEDVWNQALQMSLGDRINPDSEDVLREDEARQLLPSYAYIDLEKISNMIEIPTKFDVYSLKGLLDSLGNPLNYRYKVTGFVLGVDSTPYRSYHYDEIAKTVTYYAEDKTKKVRKVSSLIINSVKGVYLSRREVDIE